jgi:hypothetical protein
MSVKQVKYFEDPIYGFVYFFFEGKEGLKDLEKLLKGNKDYHSPSQHTVAQTLYIPDFNKDIGKFKNISILTAVWFGDLFREKRFSEQISVIAHECYHLRERTLPNIGVSEEYGEYNEHYAYYMGFLVEKYTEFLYENILE